MERLLVLLRGLSLNARDLREHGRCHVTMYEQLPELMTEVEVVDHKEEVRRLLRPRLASKSRSPSSSPSSIPSSDSSSILSSSPSSSSSGLVPVAGLRFLGVTLLDGLVFPISIHWTAVKVWQKYPSLKHTESIRGTLPLRKTVRR